jgi:pimeloyl-ACP methyl ester carboxylesterase
MYCHDEISFATVRRRWLSVGSLCGTLLVLAGCGGDGGTGPEEAFDRADLTLLFAPVTDSERRIVLAEWASRDVGAHDVQVLLRDTVTVGIDTVEVRILSHRVQGNRHYGALVVPIDGQGTLRTVLAYSHFSNVGVNVESTLFSLGAVAGLRSNQFALSIPSYRGKTLSYGTQSWTSEGSVSIWDGEVDDALALIHVAWQQPGVATGNAAAFGLSGGGAIALLTAIREPGVTRVVDFFAPTDFFGPFAQQLLLDILDDQPPDLSSVPDLQNSVVDPFERGDLSLADMRFELLRRSASHFADRLPAVLAHHGTADDVVHVGETETLEAAILAAGGSIDATYYAGGGHNPFGLQGSMARTAAFLTLR